MSTFGLSWDTLQSIVGGRSAIDVPRLYLSDLTAAEAFIARYGFDWEEELHRQAVEDLRSGAIALIEETLLRDGEAIGRDVRNERDVRFLLLWAAADAADEPQRWACAVLRVMHTLAHSRSFVGECYGELIRAQILDRFEPFVHRSPEGTSIGVGSEAISLTRFEVRPVKTARSVAMKLLHKAENVAADVFDWIGVRFVTRHRLDALLVVQRLREQNVIMFANTVPNRARNTLIDLDWLADEVDALERRVALGDITQAEQATALHRGVDRRPFAMQPAVNPHSSVAYHSIQFTCRELVHVPDVVAENGGRPYFFFPYEVQILDEASYQASRSGLASHSEYKARQIADIRRRVLGPLVGNN